MRGFLKFEPEEHSAPLRRLQAALLLLTVGFIWTHSLMPAEISAQESSRFALFFAPILRDLGLRDLDAELLDHLVRKLAHFTEFTALGAQLCLLWGSGGPAKALRAWIGGFFIAFMDETLQLFTPGRSGELRDVWLDASGVLFGVLLALVVLRLYRRRKKARKTER